jgi:hypothetical protein
MLYCMLHPINALQFNYLFYDVLVYDQKILQRLEYNGNGFIYGQRGKIKIRLTQRELYWVYWF